MTTQNATRFAPQFWLITAVILAAWLLTGLFSPAYGSSLFGFDLNWLFGPSGFHCVGPVPSGKLFNAAPTPAGIDSTQIFTFFVAKFESIMSEIYSTMFCGMQDAIAYPLSAVLTLFVSIMGAGFLIGIIPMTGKELTIIFTKFTLVLLFSTQADLAIGLVYNFFITSAREGIEIVLSTMYLPGGGVGGMGEVFGLLDDAFGAILNKTELAGTEGNLCKNGLFAFLALVMVAFPPLFAIAMLIIIKLVVAFVRAVFGYLFALLGITFLLTLLPIFASFALFNPTRAIFDKYVGYIISFAFQMLVVFAFLAMILSMDIYGKFGDMFDLVVPMADEDKVQLTGSASALVNFEKLIPLPSCTLCQVELREEGNMSSGYMCKLDGSGSPIPMRPSDLTSFVDNPDDPNGDPLGFIKFIGTQVMILAALAYLIEGMLAFVPGMARELGGQRNAGQLGGAGANVESYGAKIDMVGSGLASDVMGGFQQGFDRGAAQGGGSVSGVVEGFKEASSSLLVGQRDKEGNAVGQGGLIHRGASYIGNLGGKPLPPK